jgi:two-component system, OmpR family, response regulator VicR
MIEVLLIEDERLLARIVKESLEGRGFRITLAADGEEGLRLYRERRPQVVVLDVMMPRLDGFSVAQQIRQSDVDTPILFLTARTQAADVVKGFELGGDDYLRKPFSMEELIVRIHALLKRRPALVPPENNFRIGRYAFDPVRQALSLDGQQQALSHRESEMLRLLCLHQNQVLERKSALLDLWGDDSFFNARSMDVFITKLRQRLSGDPAVQIVNVRGVGYKLIVP